MSLSLSVASQKSIYYNDVSPETVVVHRNACSLNSTTRIIRNKENYVRGKKKQREAIVQTALTICHSWNVLLCMKHLSKHLFDIDSARASLNTIADDDDRETLFVFLSLDLILLIH